MKRERGFTLTELMVVVAIVGVLATLAAIYMRPKVKAIDAANRVGDLLREANRRAVALGPVRPDVAVAYGRARTEIVGAVSGSTVTFTLYALTEAALPAATATWQPVTSYVLDKAVLGDSWSASLGTHAAVPLTTSWATFQAQCYPSGTCDARTLFFQAANMDSVPTADCYAKLAIMPLGGAITTRRDWN